MKCYEYGLKTGGQIDLILRLLANRYLLKSGNLQTAWGGGAASEVVINGMSSVLHEAGNALAATHEKDFQNILKGLDSAIMFAKNGEFYDAGETLRKLASDPNAISNRALWEVFPDIQMTLSTEWTRLSFFYKYFCPAVADIRGKCYTSL
ncbi:MAG: hypothetical protein QCH35_03340 [Methanomicrobiaceae archaeon]|nr:hypothetical protein [Methanomicrobiaceae archaeon]